MKIAVPKIVKTLAVGEYAQELSEVRLQVWVNPPRSLLARHDALIERVGAAARAGADEAGLSATVTELWGEMTAVFAELWSAGPEGTHWSAEEIEALIDGMAETDPQLWPWLRKRTILMIREHREAVKKD